MKAKRTTMPRAFDDTAKTAKPCEVCLKLARQGCIQSRAVMPLPNFPARSKHTNEPICRDCQATETGMQIYGIHPDFGAARLCIANERCESLVMPFGMAEHFGLCREGLVRPASIDDLDAHRKWLKKNGIPDNACAEPFGDE